MAYIAFDADFAAMRFDCQPAECEPEPSAMLLVFLRVDLTEFLKNPLVELLRYSWTVIGNRNTRLLVVR